MTMKWPYIIQDFYADVEYFRPLWYARIKDLKAIQAYYPIFQGYLPYFAVGSHEHCLCQLYIRKIKGAL
jgi:hypothetical protein